MGGHKDNPRLMMDERGGEEWAVLCCVVCVGVSRCVFCVRVGSPIFWNQKKRAHFLFFFPHCKVFCSDLPFFFFFFFFYISQ